jgi:hypothetical protein
MFTIDENRVSDDHTKEAAMTNKCTSVVGHFDGYGSAPEQYRWHRPMRHV